LKEGISVCAWLGIAGQTDWNQLVESNTPAARDRWRASVLIS